MPGSGGALKYTMKYGVISGEYTVQVDGDTDGCVFLCNWLSEEPPVLATPPVAPGNPSPALPGLGPAKSPCSTERSHPMVHLVLH